MKHTDGCTNANQDLTIVLMTRQGDPFGLSVLEQFEQHGHPISAAILEVDSFRRRLSRLRRLLKRSGPMRLLRRVGDHIYWVVHRRLREVCLKSEHPTSYGDLCKEIIWVDNVNESQRVLRDIEPDVVILGGARILRKEVIQVPRIGILNAHPGLLPEYRGLNVLEWAILNGANLGVTVHFVDEGVDTGPIVLQKRLTVQPGKRLSDLKREASSLSVEMLVEAVELIAAGKASPQSQREEEGKQYRSMPRSLQIEVDRKLAKIGTSFKKNEKEGQGAREGLAPDSPVRRKTVGS